MAREGKLAVFDFDKTLSYVDSVWGFFWLASEGVAMRRLKGLIYFLHAALAKVGVISARRVKTFGIRVFLGHRTREDLERVAERYAETIELNKVYREVYLSCQDPWVVSASFSIYLRHLFPEERLIAADLEFTREGIATGEFRSCRAMEKVERLRQAGIHSIDQFFSDSKTDGPVAAISKEVFQVSGDEFRKVDALT